MTDPLVRMYLDEIKGAVAARRHFDAELNVVAAEIKRLYGDNLTTKIDTKDVAFLITKANDDADWFNLSGVASTDAVDLGDDIIAAGAFGSIDPSHVAMLFMHSPETPIGKWLEVTQEGRQLHCKGAILKSLTKGQEAATMISKGMITGLSVGLKSKRRSSTRPLAYGGSPPQSFTRFQSVRCRAIGQPAFPRRKNRCRRRARSRPCGN